MPWGQIGAVLAVLVIVIRRRNPVVSFLEAILGQLKKWLSIIKAGSVARPAVGTGTGGK